VNLSGVEVDVGEEFLLPPGCLFVAERFYRGDVFCDEQGKPLDDRSLQKDCRLTGRPGCAGMFLGGAESDFLPEERRLRAEKMQLGARQGGVYCAWGPKMIE